MRTFLLLPIAACAVAFGAVPAVADVVPGVPTEETEIRSVLGRWDRARAQHDVRVLTEILAEEFVASGPGEREIRRAEILARGAPERGARLITRDEIEIVVDGATATARGRVTRIGTPAGAHVGEVTDELATLERDGAGWRLVATRSTPPAPRARR